MEINAIARKVTEQDLDDRRTEQEGGGQRQARGARRAPLAAELSQERAAHDTTRRPLDNKVEQLSQRCANPSRLGRLER